MIDHLVLLGAKGDLTSRYLLPAVAELCAAGGLPQGFRITGMARDEGDTESFREGAAEALARSAASVPAAARQALVSALTYVEGDATRREDVAAAVGADHGPVAAYLALPPSVFAPAIEALLAAGPPEGSCVVVEKPFGEDLASARALNELLHRGFTEEHVFRVDHFLAMQTVQNILGLRFANRVFERVWGRDDVEGVEVVWDETLTLEDRASYYDQTGALRDMIQNHLLQLLCMVAMEPPPSLDADAIRDRKVELLDSVRRLGGADAAEHSVRARYTPGRIGDREVPAYTDEDGVDPKRETETFAQLRLYIDNDRWRGVPFTLRSGKALGSERREVVVRFSLPGQPAFCEVPGLRRNELRIPLRPERLLLDINLNSADEAFGLERVSLGADLAPTEPSAYARLIGDVLRGDPTLSIRDDEAEASWEIVEPVLDAWERGAVPLQEYAAGSDGPAGAR